MLKQWAFLAGAPARSMTMAPPSTALADDAAVVAHQVEKLRAAMVAPTETALDLLVSDLLSYGHSNGSLQDKTAFIAALLSGESDFVTITLSEQTIQMVRDVAVVRHTLRAKTNDSGRPGDVSLKILMIWQKQEDGWKLLARQAVRYAG